MKEELNLSDEQMAKMTASRKATSEKMKAIQESKTLNDEQKHQQSRDLMKKQKADMKSILTDEQMQKLKEHHKQHPGKRKVAWKRVSYTSPASDKVRGFLVTFAENTVVKQQNC